MVTAVTVTVFLRNLASQGEALGIAGEKPKSNREKDGTFLSFAYTQMIVCLYANDCAPIRNLIRISKIEHCILASSRHLH